MMASSNWKFMSFALMGVLGIGFIIPQQLASAADSVLSLIQDIQKKINDPNLGLATRASQSSVDALQTTESAVRAKTDNLPADPASDTALTSATNAINTNTNNAVGGLATAAAVSTLQNGVGAIRASTDLLPEDPASNTALLTRASQAAVDDLADAATAAKDSALTQIVSRDITNGLDDYVVHSDSPYIMDICVENSNTNSFGNLLAVFPLEDGHSGDNLIRTWLDSGVSRCITISNTDTARELEVRVSPETIGQITIQAPDGAVVSIEAS